MTDPLIIGTLRRKREEIEAQIVRLENQAIEARHDLLHINVTIRLFEVNGEATEFPVYVDLSRMFSRGEIARHCKEALHAAPEGQLDTRELTLYVLTKRGWDTTDKALWVSVAHRITHTLCVHERQGTLQRAGKRKGVNVWRATEAARLPAA